jgi:hypothetical protein
VNAELTAELKETNKATPTRFHFGWDKSRGVPSPMAFGFRANELRVNTKHESGLRRLKKALRTGALLIFSPASIQLRF